MARRLVPAVRRFDGGRSRRRPRSQWTVRRRPEAFVGSRVGALAALRFDGPLHAELALVIPTLGTVARSDPRPRIDLHRFVPPSGRGEASMVRVAPRVCAPP